MRCACGEIPSPHSPPLEAFRRQTQPRPIPTHRRSRSGVLGFSGPVPQFQGQTRVYARSGRMFRSNFRKPRPGPDFWGSWLGLGPGFGLRKASIPVFTGSTACLRATPAALRPMSNTPQDVCAGVEGPWVARIAPQDTRLAAPRALPPPPPPPPRGSKFEAQPHLPPRGKELGEERYVPACSSRPQWREPLLWHGRRRGGVWDGGGGGHAVAADPGGSVGAASEGGFVRFRRRRREVSHRPRRRARQLRRRGRSCWRNRGGRP